MFSRTDGLMLPNAPARPTKPWFQGDRPYLGELFGRFRKVGVFLLGLFVGFVATTVIGKLQADYRASLGYGPTVAECLRVTERLLR